MKDKNTAGILALIFGGVGVHRFYLGQPGLGVVYLLFCWTFIPAVISFIEALYFFFMNPQAFDARYNLGFAGAQGAFSPGPASNQNIVVNVSGSEGGGSSSGKSVAAQVRELHELKEMGAISESEYEAEKAKLLT